MLVLSRRRNEGTFIGDDIEVVVLEVRGDKVKLGFLAPRSVQIHRLEVWNARNESEQTPRTLDGCIVLCVVDVRGDKARLGIEADKEVPVHRREVYEAIKRDAAAQQGDPGPLMSRPEEGMLVLSRKRNEKIVIQRV